MNRIESLRKSRGWNQDDLAKLLNVKRAAVSKYETEKISLSAETIKKLCDIFDVSSDYLLCFSDDKKQAVKDEQPVPDERRKFYEFLSQLSDEELNEIRHFAEYTFPQHKIEES